MFKKTSLLLFLNIDDDDIECDYSDISSTRMIISRYHNMDLAVNELLENQVIIDYKSSSTLEKMIWGKCSQTVDVLCQPWTQELYIIDKYGSGAQNDRCRCFRWGFNRTKTKDFNSR